VFRSASRLGRHTGKEPGRREFQQNWLERYYEKCENDEILKQKQEFYPVLPPTKHKRKQVFLEFTSNNENLGRMTFTLADDLLPITTQNFINLCKGFEVPEMGKLQYEGTIVHQIMKGEFFVAGDVTGGKGRGGHSTMGTRWFDDEGYFVKHTKPGVLAMANSGVHRNESVFVVTMQPAPYMDGTQVAFGELVEGQKVLDRISSHFQIKGEPLDPIVISKAGVVGDE